MIREPIVGVPARTVTADASARFTYLAETIARAYEPSQTQLDDLERAYNATGDYLAECPEFDGLLTQVHAQGSRLMGTIVRPMDPKHEGFDIDLVARLARAALHRYGGGKGTVLLLDHLFTALSRYAKRHGLGIEKWERCVTLIYAGGMRADFAPVIDDPAYTLPYGEHHGRIPDRDLSRYLSTNPKGYCLGFDDVAKVSPVFNLVAALEANYDSVRKADVEPLPEASQVFGRLLSRFIQLGKVHRNIAFADVPSGKDLAPTSVFLTSLFSKAYAVLAPQPHDGPLDLFFAMVELVPMLFERELLAGGGEHWVLMNPCAQFDNLASSMNTVGRQQAFVQWHAKLLSDLNVLLAAVDSNKGLDVVVKAVERAFGSRASEAVLQRGAQRREGHRALHRAGFVVAGTLSAVAPARAHTYFGGPLP
ncbi:nucleotidyltransferase domain-containing protein [Azohydromonas lata]|uniref:Nucleotidyltransferase n=1 Tax=Azohydromonas lata TaxID=45677 RepID=A0ABU5I9L5_9BURK|nr:nucleotidyltransferase [Azohydromonas lata]MDZ5455794.1 nucleotidyltransferase [Azohydromonas lata]